MYSMYAIATIFIVMVPALIFHVRAQPFENPWVDRVELLSLVSTLITLWLGSFFEGRERMLFRFSDSSVSGAFKHVCAREQGCHDSRWNLGCSVHTATYLAKIRMQSDPPSKDKIPFARSGAEEPPSEHRLSPCGACGAWA